MQHHSILGVLACTSCCLAHNTYCCPCICSAASTGSSTRSRIESSHCHDNLLDQQKLAHVLHEFLQHNSTSLRQGACCNTSRHTSQQHGMRLVNVISDAQQLQFRFAQQSDGISPASRRPQTPRLCSATTKVLMTSRGCRCRFAE